MSEKENIFLKFGNNDNEVSYTRIFSSSQDAENYVLNEDIFSYKANEEVNSLKSKYYNDDSNNIEYVVYEDDCVAITKNLIGIADTTAKKDENFSVVVNGHFMFSRFIGKFKPGQNAGFDVINSRVIPIELTEDGQNFKVINDENLNGYPTEYIAIAGRVSEVNENYITIDINNLARNIEFIAPDPEPEYDDDNYFIWKNITPDKVKKNQIVTFSKVTNLFPLSFVGVATQDIESEKSGTVQVYGIKTFKNVNIEDIDKLKIGLPVWYNPNDKNSPIYYMPNNEYSFALGSFLSYDYETKELKVLLNEPHDINEKFIPYYNDNDTEILQNTILSPNSDPNQDEIAISITKIPAKGYGVIQYSGVYTLEDNSELQEKIFGLTAYYNKTTKKLTNLTDKDNIISGMYLKNLNKDNRKYALIEINKLSISRFDFQKIEEKVVETS